MRDLAWGVEIMCIFAVAKMREVPARVRREALLTQCEVFAVGESKVLVSQVWV